jgi:hypothetical protein
MGTAGPSLRIVPVHARPHMRASGARRAVAEWQAGPYFNARRYFHLGYLAARAFAADSHRPIPV